MEKKDWLILGGVGYIGRNLVKFLIDHEVANTVTVVDKCIPDMCHFHPIHEAAFIHPSVHRLQMDLSRDPTKAFAGNPHVVVNLSGETRPAMPDQRYELSSLKVVQQCIPLVSQDTRWIEVSTAQVYRASTTALSEDAAIEPSSRLAYWRFLSERAILPLNHVILRPGIVYGDGDFTGLSNVYSAPKLIIGAVYQRLNETMRVPWIRDLPQHTIHVQDLCRAITVVVSSERGAVYNVVDAGDTRNGTITAFIEPIFHVRVSYMNAALRSLAFQAAELVCEEANEKHMTPWSQLCEEQIIYTPLSPYLELEDMKGIPISLDNSRLKSTGWEPLHPEVTGTELVRSLRILMEAGAWPQVPIYP